MESEYERAERVRQEFLTRMSRAGTLPKPNHTFQDWQYDEHNHHIYSETCTRCPPRSPYKGNRAAHPYVIDEDPF